MVQNYLTSQMLGNNRNSTYRDQKLFLAGCYLCVFIHQIWYQSDQWFTYQCVETSRRIRDPETEKPVYPNPYVSIFLVHMFTSLYTIYLICNICFPCNTVRPGNNGTGKYRDWWTKLLVDIRIKEHRCTSKLLIKFLKISRYFKPLFV